MAGTPLCRRFLNEDGWHAAFGPTWGQIVECSDICFCHFYASWAKPSGRLFHKFVGLGWAFQVIV